MADQTNKFLQSVLIDVVKHEKRHRWYDRTVEKAQLYIQLSTGEGSDELLKKFSRETEEGFKQRVEITQQIHSSIVDTLSLITSKIPRSSGVTKIYNYKDETKDEELTRILDEFNGDKSFDDWLDTRFFQLNDTDPNAFCVIEFDPTDGTRRVQPFPFIVSSKEAIFYKYINNVLQYLIVENDIVFFDPKEDEDKEGKKWTIYGKSNSIKIVQIPMHSLVNGQLKMFTIPPQVRDFEIFIVGGQEYMIRQGDLFIVITSVGYDTNDVVPAFRFGYNLDKFTGSTFVPHWNSAIPYLMKTVKVVSELDLTSSMHAFPQKISQQPRCTECGGKGQCEIIVSEGVTKKGICQTCKGSGGDTHTSAQDEIIIKLPEQPDPDQLADLSKFVHYVQGPIDIIKWQEEYTISLKVQCKEAVFNSAVWNKEDVNKTATGVIVNSENVNDSLYIPALHYVKVWAFCIDIISKVTNLNADLEIITNVNKDLKLKNKEDYLNELKMIKDADGSQELKNDVEEEIMRLTTESDADSFNKWTTKRFFAPYSGKSNNEIIVIISSLPLTDPKRVLWSDFGNIFNQIELEDGQDFYNFDKNKQAEIINAKVQERIAEIQASRPAVSFEPDINE